MPSEVLQFFKCCYNGHFCTIAHKHVMLAILVDKNTFFKVINIHAADADKKYYLFCDEANLLTFSFYRKHLLVLIKNVLKYRKTIS